MASKASNWKDLMSAVDTTQGLKAWLLARGATGSDLTELQMSFLASKGYTGGLVDRWISFFTALGFTGSITDMWHQFFETPVLGLFSNGEKGIWLDPSDLSTMWQDAAGTTTPVTAVEQPVGHIKDKSGNGLAATQPAGANKPYLRARYNWATYSEDFRNTADAGSSRPWVYFGTTTNHQTAGEGPIAGTLASELVETATTAVHGTIQIIDSQVSQPYVISCYVKAKERSWVQLFENSGSACSAYFDVGNGVVGTTGGSNTTAEIQDVGNGWYRCILKIVSAPTGNKVNASIRLSVDGTSNSYAGDITKGIRVFGFQITEGTEEMEYQRIAANTSYDSDSTKFPWYLAFDGISDAMSVTAVDLSGTDAVTVVAGVRKDNDGAQGVVCELTSNIGTQTGAFLLAAPDGATATFAFDSKGTVQTDAVSPTTFAAPSTKVVTGQADISGDTATLRVNGVLQDTDSGDQGTGNYKNTGLYIGARGGTSVFFKGNLYGLVVRGAATSAGEVRAVENYLANQMGGIY